QVGDRHLRAERDPVDGLEDADGHDGAGEAERGRRLQVLPRPPPGARPDQQHEEQRGPAQPEPGGAGRARRAEQPGRGGRPGLDGDDRADGEQRSVLHDAIPCAVIDPRLPRVCGHTIRWSRMIEGMETRLLRTLVELDRRGTMRAVAAATGYGTSAVSQQIAALERELGAELIERTGRTVRLTGAGRRLAEQAVRILAAEEAARAALAADGEPAGLVTVAAYA